MIYPYVKIAEELAWQAPCPNCLQALSYPVYLVHAKDVCENQAGRGCIGQMFIWRQTLEHTSREPTISPFLALTAAFHSVDRAVRWTFHSVNGVPEKFTSLIQFPYANGRSRVRAYDDVSSEFTTSSVVRQDYSLSL